MKQKNFLKIAMLFVFAVMTNNSFGQVFITEIADPNDNAAARYVEIFNQGNSSVDLSSWALRRWTNASASPQSDVSLSGTILSKGFVVFASNSSSFNTAYSSFSGTVVQLGTGGPVDSNGDDNIALIDNNGDIVDIFGLPGEDGSGTCHEFEDGRAERKATVLTGETTWNEADWNVWADSTVGGCTTHTNDSQNEADGDFDPGSWIGDSSVASPGITLGSVSNNTNETGTTATFTVVLDVQPTTDVVLNISSGDTGEVTLDLATLTFTNADWDTPQTVTATGVDDALQDGSIVVTITVAVDDASSDDDYDAVVDATTTVTNEDDELPNLIINEFQADPDATLGDANGDGSVDTGDDEFIEIYNASGAELNITNYTIEDSSGLRHTFPDGTILPAGAVIVVFGGGTPTGIPCLTQIASEGFLGLNNGGDSITIKDASSTVVTTYTYGSEGGDNQSIGRDTDLTGAFVKHSTIAGNAVLFSPGRKNADNIPFSKTWTGTTDNDWATTTNWDSSSNPSTSTDNVWIPAGLTNYPTSTAAVTVNSVTINSGATLKAEDDFTGNVTYNRTVGFESGNLNGWYLMSSPIVGQVYDDGYVTANDIALGTGDNRGIATYTTGSDSWVYHQGAASATFTTGKGYSVKRETNTGTVSFTGTLNTNDAGVDFVLDTDGNRINLLGNPYTSSISSGTLLANAALSETQTMWIYDQTSGTNGGYAVSTLGENFILAPGQGFFVTANIAGGTVNFAEANQSHNADTFQRTANTEIKVQISVDGFQNYAKVYYLDNATIGFDVGYEGELFGGTSDSFSIYTQLLADNIDKKYQVQSLPNSDYENMVIPVGVKAAAGKEITFTADAFNVPSGLKVFLEDRQTNTFTRLDETNSEYKVTLTETLNGLGRFYMHTTESAMSTEDVLLNSVRIFKTNASTLKITGLPQGKTSFYLYNILGKEMMTTIFASNGNKEISVSKLASGIYLAKIQTEKGAISKKIILE
jgi:hypothetical protein